MYKQSKQSKLINNLIAENKIITIQIVFMFKNFCCCNAIISDLYDGKSKNKTAVIFFSNSLVVLQKSIMTAFNLLYIVGTPPLLKGGGQDLQKFESPGGGDTKNFARKGDNPEKGGGGGATFFLI